MSHRERPRSVARRTIARWLRALNAGRLDRKSVARRCAYLDVVLHAFRFSGLKSVSVNE